jgi:hypothetical protein
VPTWLELCADGCNKSYSVLSGVNIFLSVFSICIDRFGCNYVQQNCVQLCWTLSSLINIDVLEVKKFCNGPNRSSPYVCTVWRWDILKVKTALLESLCNVTEHVSSVAILLYYGLPSISRTIKYNSIPIHYRIHPYPHTLAAPTDVPHDFSQSFHTNFTRSIPNYIISKLYK